MKLTIIKEDGTVYKDDKVYRNIDLNQIPSDVHALQWNNGNGHIEFVNNIKANENITELPSWANDAVTAWQNVYEVEQAEIARLEAEAETKRLAKQQAQAV
jgi:hypothetical protein